MKSKFSLTRKDEQLMELVGETDRKTLAVWATDCAERVLSYFERKFPDDRRPRKALETLREWLKTGEFKMAVIRKASLDSHAAAREVGAESPARSAARAAGQAVATAHVPRHAYGAAIYAQQAVFRAADSATAPAVPASGAALADADAAATKERDWQYRHLLELIELKLMH